MADLIRGGDYSRFQGPIEWDRVPSDRLLAIIGMWDWVNLAVDQQLARNVREAKRTGRTVGGYMRVNPTRWPAATEAKRMLELLAEHDLGQPGCLWPSVDIEPTNTPADATVDWPRWTRDFFKAWAELTDLPLLVYTSGSWFASLLGGTADWPSWVKCWVGHTEQWSVPKGVPTEEWAGKTKHELERAVVHQYSHTGRLSGIAGDVDLDCLMPGVALESITLQDSGGHMGVIAPRASWGPIHSDGFAAIGTGAWKDIYVHHSVTSVPGGANASVAQEQQHMRDLERIGQNSFGGGISYTVIVFPSGRAYQGHSLTTRGAHTYQRNDSARAICFVGNFENEQPTNAAINTACLILTEWGKAGFPSRVTGGHRDVYATACPGKNLYAALSRIKAGAGTPQEGDVTAQELWNHPIDKDPSEGDPREDAPAWEMVKYTNQAAWAAADGVKELLERPVGEVTLSPEDRAAIVADLKAELVDEFRDIVVDGVKKGVGQMHAVFADRPNEGL